MAALHTSRRDTLGRLLAAGIVVAAPAEAASATPPSKGTARMDTAERLAAIEDIKVLKARYFRFVDTQAWGELRKLFTDDALLSLPESRPEPTPIDAVIAAVTEALRGGVSVHHGHMPEIEILSPDSARGIWAMEDRLYFPPGVTGMKGASAIHGAGHYHETYVRQGGAWLIRSLRLTRLRFDVQLQPRSIT